MTTNDELAGRMARMAANIAYGVCAETRHVTLGDKCAEAILAAAKEMVGTPPCPAGIPWVPIADMPEDWKSRFEVLLWEDGFVRAATWSFTRNRWEDGDTIVRNPTYAAEINPPEGV